MCDEAITLQAQFSTMRLMRHGMEAILDNCAFNYFWKLSTASEKQIKNKQTNKYGCCYQLKLHNEFSRRTCTFLEQTNLAAPGSVFVVVTSYSAKSPSFL